MYNRLMKKAFYKSEETVKLGQVIIMNVFDCPDLGRILKEMRFSQRTKDCFLEQAVHKQKKCTPSTVALNS